MQRFKRAGSAMTASALLTLAVCGLPASGEATAVSAQGPATTNVGLAAASARGEGSAPGRCRTEALSAHLGRQDPGAGNVYAPLVLTNTSAQTCWVYGFVGLVMFDGNGDAMRTRVRRENVRPQRVVLKPKASAHARLHWVMVQTGAEKRCPTSARLMIIPPDEVAHLEIPFTAMACDSGRIDVRPLAPGARA
ncbi:DUF4232 domain-containing protein [Nonomuraea sp. NPDC049625]|uniref:DUF4232 domain-containing protein n=1 Tax=Nonomuraea sp. NPDC049625 TaxID=3155775 RepID=UPI003436093D